MAIQTNPHIPTWILLPTNNNRTAYRPFGLPMILMETDRRDLSGNPIANSGVIVQNCDCSNGCDCMGVITPTCNEFCNGAAARIVIENVPHKSLVVGQIPIGLMSPDHEIYARTITMTELTSRMIHPEMQTFWRITAINSQGVRTWEPIAYEDAIAGDLMQYIAASGTSTTKEFMQINPATDEPYPENVIPYYPTANYYDLSDIVIDVGTLPPDWYYLSYQAEYYARVESTSTPGQLNCIDITRKATSIYRFKLNHPGQVMEETVRLTPAPYLTSDQKGQDTTIEFYRPFTDILQDIFDEQALLEQVNWCDYITPQFVPYLCFLLGLDIPYFPQSLDRLRKTMLRNVVRLQQLKGSRNAIYDLFEMFGYIVYVNSLYWSADGKRLIRPGEKLPTAYANQEIQVEERCQIEPVLVRYNTDEQTANGKSPSSFGNLTIPLLYRPMSIDQSRGIINTTQGSKIVLSAYLVRQHVLGTGTVSTSTTTDLVGTATTFLTDFAVGDKIYLAGESEKAVVEVIDDLHMVVDSAFNYVSTNVDYAYVSRTYKRLEEISCGIGTAEPGCDNNPGDYTNCELPYIPHTHLDGLDSWSRTTIDANTTVGNPKHDVVSGDQPPFISSGISIDRDANLLHLTFNGAIQFSDEYGLQGPNGLNSKLYLYTFASYSREQLIVPDAIKNLRSNRFDIQLLTQDGDQISGDILDFLIDYLFKIKAFHSLLYTLIYHANLNETYQVTSFCVGGDLEQRWDTDAGRLQVPPAILPHPPIDGCHADPTDLGYKPEDLALRKKILDNLRGTTEEFGEFQAWVNVDQYLAQKVIVGATGATGPIYVPRSITQGSGERLAPTPVRDTCSGVPGATGTGFTYRGQDRLTPGGQVEKDDETYGPTPFDNSTSVASQSNLKLSPITNGSHGQFYPTGADASSDNDSSGYSKFVREYSIPSVRESAGATGPHTFCVPNGVSDYCYKGRVDDELLHRMTLLSEEQYQATACTINFGRGIYYYFPATSELTNSIQGPALKQPYDVNIPDANNNFLGRLLRAYDTVNGENIHYTDRPYLTPGVSGESNLLALQRPNLNIQVPLTHFPGTRFATLNKLKSDYTHPTWMAKPWDDQYSTNCGPYTCNKPTYLNAILVENTAGDQTLEFDSVPFIIIANGLESDIPSFGSHILGTNSNFTSDEVTHSIYLNQPSGSAAITLDSVVPPPRTTVAESLNYTHGGITWLYNYVFDRVPTITVGVELNNLADSIYPMSVKIISVTPTSALIRVYRSVLDGVDLVFSECDTDDVILNLRACAADGIINALTTPLFPTAALCSGSTDQHYIDYIDGYPASTGYQPYIADDFDRSGMYTELFNELGIDRSMPTGSEVLFYFISGIYYQKGYRFGCNCDVLICELGGPVPETQVLNCSLNHYWVGDGYDYNPDSVSVDLTLDARENIGVHDIAFDGQIPNMLELADSTTYYNICDKYA